MMTEKMTIGEKIKLWRQKRNLTQDGLSKKANLPVSSVSKLEAGYIMDPRLSTVILLAEALEVTIDELIKD